MQYATLKQRHRKERDAQPIDARLRLHRALSWLHRAEQADDIDARFVFLWIAFNAAYAQEIDENDRLSEQTAFKSFLGKLCEMDISKRIDALVWKEFPGSVRTLLDNPYVFQAFWDFQRGKLTEPEWKDRFASGKKAAQKALAGGNTLTVLGITFNRIYTLRNQMIHGGATWGSSVNREQLRDCVNLLGKLVPLVVELMMDNPHAQWGSVCYPVVDE